MPYITVKALPLGESKQIPQIIQAVSCLFAEATGIEEDHITVTWETLAPGHYAKGGEVADQQNFDTHPLMAEVLIPDSNDAETVQFILHTMAKILAEVVGFPIHRVFIHCRLAQSGYVFDDGEIAEW